MTKIYSITEWFDKLNSKKHFTTTLSNVAKLFGLRLDHRSIIYANYFDSLHKNWRTSKAWLSYLAEQST